MGMSEVVVIPTRVANIASMMAALKRAGVDPILDGTPSRVYQASHVVLPGVGTFQAGMEELLALDVASTIIKRIQEQKRMLCVCVGMQLLFAKSEESPGISGLNVFQGDFKRFPPSVRVPQFGWNKVNAEESCTLLTSGYAYFANSYRVTNVPSVSSVAMANHGGEFVAAFETGGLLACQFHPELSGSWGQELIQRWLYERYNETSNDYYEINKVK